MSRSLLPPGGAALLLQTTQETAMQRLLFVLALAALCSCSSPGIEVGHEYGRASFSGFGPTYAWIEMAPGEVPKDAPDSKELTPTPDVLAFIKQCIDQELQAKGYHLGVGKVDFLVASRTSKKFAVARPTWDLEQYEEGALEVFMIQPDTRELMWRGIARAALDMSLTPTERRDRLQKGIKLMLKSFPDQGKEPKR
jgi:hypothetical protein